MGLFGLFKKRESETVVETPKQDLNQEQVQEKVKGILVATKPRNVKYVTKNVVISDMMNYGLHCVGCSASTTDTIETGAKSHGMSDAEVDELVKEVNQVLDGSHPAMQQKN